jgi:hypothetical protein
MRRDGATEVTGQQDGAEHRRARVHSAVLETGAACPMVGIAVSCNQAGLPGS